MQHGIVLTETMETLIISIEITSSSLKMFKFFSEYMRITVLYDRAS